MKGSNYFTRPVAGVDDDAQWKSDVALLTSIHRELRASIAGLSLTHLERAAHGGNETILNLVIGIAAHDLYHAGQIQLLKRLQQ
jgi:hypothetical protein